MKQEQLDRYLKLQFEINNPDVEMCWQEGYQSNLNEQDEFENPYDKGSEAFQYWNEGWWAACYGEEPLFDLASNAVAEHVEYKAKKLASESQWAVWGRMIAYRLFELSAATMIAIVGYQLAEFALI